MNTPDPYSFVSGNLVILSDGRRGQVLAKSSNRDVFVGINPRNFGLDTLHDSIVLCPRKTLKNAGLWRRPE